jgi:hypothetical protein
MSYRLQLYKKEGTQFFSSTCPRLFLIATSKLFSQFQSDFPLVFNLYLEFYNSDLSEVNFIGKIPPYFDFHIELILVFNHHRVLSPIGSWRMKLSNFLISFSL